MIGLEKQLRSVAAVAEMLVGAKEAAVKPGLGCAAPVQGFRLETVNGFKGL